MIDYHLCDGGNHEEETGCTRVLLGKVMVKVEIDLRFSLQVLRCYDEVRVNYPPNGGKR